jgi:hypothetical protein
VRLGHEPCRGRLDRWHGRVTPICDGFVRISAGGCAVTPVRYLDNTTWQRCAGGAEPSRCLTAPPAPQRARKPSPPTTADGRGGRHDRGHWRAWASSLLDYSRAATADRQLLHVAQTTLPIPWANTPESRPCPLPAIDPGSARMGGALLILHERHGSRCSLQGLPGSGLLHVVGHDSAR